MPWWKRCCGAKPNSDAASGNSKTSANQTSDSRVSSDSVRSEEEVLAAIEAEVDESLEVLSNQSGEIRERDSSRHGSSLYRKQRSNSGPKRGFGLHIDLTQQRGGPTKVDPNGDVNTPRSENGDTTYLAAPYSPDTPASLVSLRSDAGSAYFSSSQVDENESRDAGDSINDPVSSNNSSMVMDDRPSMELPPATHIA